MANKKKVLITGAAGRIGKVLNEGLKDRYEIRVLYNRTVLDSQYGEEVMTGSITDLERMMEVVDGCDAVIHMAGNPSMKAAFMDLHDVNSLGTYCVFEACARQGVPRVVFASTNRVTGMYERDGTFTTPNMPVRPDSFYGASKAHGEALARYYADNTDLAVLCLRIGTFQPAANLKKRETDRILSTWVSAADVLQICWRAVEAKQVKFGIYYAVSANKRAYWDISNARDELGYDPVDNAEDHA